MIGLILDNQSFEQDIRELLMAFYPGERFLHEENPDEEFRLIVRSVTGEDFFQLSLEDREHKITKTSGTEVDFSDRFETKNRIKRMLYGMAGELTKKVLPWGTLTGIRPVKITMTKLLSGSGEAEVSEYMKDTYFTSDQKAELSLEIAKRELELLSSIDYEKGYSLYIGIPFCPTTCLYCSFTSFPISQWEKRMDEYLEALWKEMKFTAGRMSGRILDTVYVGGGTPTSLSAGHLETLMCRLKETFDFTNVKEFTVEAGRPDSITEEKLKVLKKYGVTRISINPQTMKEETLKVIGRRHSVEMVKDRFHLARSLGFDNINMDLIIGLPGEDIEDVRRTMEEIKSLGPDGITVHTLAIKRAARLNMFKEQYGDLKITGTQEMVDLTAACARSMGQEPYYLYRQKNMAGNFENVGYSVPGKACIYNILIMEEKQTIAACGAGTSTKVVFPAENRLERVENVKDVEQYISRIDEMIERKEKMLAKSEM
ncbi:coproporphyrinogen dehydrogenase HemZ [Clostridium boliviensis]|uniref:Coproporphyrinogen dehydrogenase HemZ n=1 Tax=Clostridium boliviensis TaxID=318465 RepID=A0ABU4GKM2_9CLOT|nr:coproporphyrinogen dehydrogenase HemZ [Clostridium boliviensis]MDW2798167.1 coproporphyrinogen dehydrogenase HemZ [Clostridium boliviensis]